MREKPMEKRENGVRVEHLTGALPMSEMLEKYVDVEKFLGYCAACPRCGQTWSCPPYDFDPAAVWPQYAAVTLYAVQVFPESEEAKAAALADRRCSSARTGERLTRCSKSGSGKRAVPFAWTRAVPRVRAMRAPGPRNPAGFRKSSAIRSNRSARTSARSPRTSWARRSNGGQRTHRRNTLCWSARC